MLACCGCFRNIKTFSLFTSSNAHKCHILHVLQLSVMFSRSCHTIDKQKNVKDLLNLRFLHPSQSLLSKYFILHHLLHIYDISMVVYGMARPGKCELHLQKYRMWHLCTFDEVKRMRDLTYIKHQQHVTTSKYYLHMLSDCFHQDLSLKYVSCIDYN